jgi:S1-C subfamily serine protease
VAVTASACVFGFLHPFGLANSIGVAVVGAVFALVYEWRKTLVTPILLHSAVNVVVMSIATWTAAADAVAPRLGVSVEGGGDGARVTQVSPGSTADTAGLRVGDVVTTVDDFSITDRLSLTEAVRRKRLGETVVVDFTRDGKALRVEAVLTKLRE